MSKAKGFINTPIPYNPHAFFYAAIWNHATDTWDVKRFLSDGTEQVLETFNFKEDADEFIRTSQTEKQA